MTIVRAHQKSNCFEARHSGGAFGADCSMDRNACGVGFFKLAGGESDQLFILCVLVIHDTFSNLEEKVTRDKNTINASVVFYNSCQSDPFLGSLDVGVPKSLFDLGRGGRDH